MYIFVNYVYDVSRLKCIFYNDNYNKFLSNNFLGTEKKQT